MTITSLNIADGTVGRTRLPRIRKRYVILITLLIIICVIIGLSFHFGLFTKKDEIVVPDPTKPLPASVSTLHRFAKAAICADSVECAEIGRNIFEKNGTAVDATLATLFCNGMVSMQSMGLGGGFLMTIYIRANQTAYVLNAREKAPLSSTAELYKSDDQASKNGPLAIAVPGELKGYWEAHQRFGKLPWKEIVQPTIDLCQSGYVITRHQYKSFFKTNLHNDSNFRTWFRDDKGKFKAAGSRVSPTKLCETLKIIAENGGNDLYNGTLSKMLLEDLKSIGSLITEEDLHSYTAEWQEPITATIRDKVKLYSVPPPGSGVLLAFILNILDGYKFKPQNIQDIDSTVGTYHKIIEAFKFAYAKRTELGDTNFVNISSLIENLTSTEYANGIRQKIKVKETSLDPKYYGGVTYTPDDHGTAHVSVLAENGDAVSVTSSINIYFGSGHTSTQTGIILNSVMDDFSFPFFKNYFNLPGSPNNAIAPGKRPLSSMTPSILVDEANNVKMVIGASGGTKITTSVALAIMRVLWFGQNIKEAVDAPRIHHQLFPMQVGYQYGTLQQVVEGLQRLGHVTQRFKDGSPIICALFKTAEAIFANADYRKGGDVSGF